MDIRIAALALGALLASASSAADSPFVIAAQRLDGVWASGNYALRVDSSRAQANVDRGKPFRWQRFLVKEVAGEKIVFTVGSELFEAILEPERMTLMSTSFRGKQLLERQEAAR